MQIQGAVQNIGTVNQGDGLFPVPSLGKQSEQLAALVHGDLYHAALRSKLFHGSTAPAGVTIPISSATAATFLLYNPAGSTVNLEVLELIVAMANATMVVSPLLLGVISAVPTGLTEITATVMAGKIGSALAAGKLYSAATIVAATAFMAVSGFSATAAGMQHHPVNLRGGLIIPPGFGVHLCGTAAQAQAAACRISWAEWLV